MQELNISAKGYPPGSRGSALVGAVVLVTLMSLMGVAFLEISAGSVRNELAARERERFFQAVTTIHLETVLTSTVWMSLSKSTSI